jgi:hypothetical protein
VIEIKYEATPKDLREAQQVLLPPGAKSPPKKQAMGSGILGWILFIGLAVMLFMMLQNRPRGEGSSVAPSTQVPAAVDEVQIAKRWIGHSIFMTGAVLFAAGIGWFLIFQGRWQRWALGRVDRYVFAEEGLKELSRFKTVEWTWEAFGSFAETEKLFVLRETPERGRVIPKRLFANDAVLTEFRALLVRKIVEPARVS